MAQDFYEQTSGLVKEIEKPDTISFRQAFDYLNEHYPYHYFKDTDEKMVGDMEVELAGLRMVNRIANQETISPPASFEYCQIGTDSFITNRPEKISEALRNGEIKEVVNPRTEKDIEQLVKYLHFNASKKYWGASDIRGCLFVALVGSEEDPAISSMHLESASVSDAEAFEEKMGYLMAPLKGEKEVTIHMVGGYEAETSIGTAMAMIHGLRENFQSLNFGTVDVFGREDGVRKPVLDTTDTRQLLFQT